jgi:hypothetical protein
LCAVLLLFCERACTWCAGHPLQAVVHAGCSLHASADACRPGDACSTVWDVLVARQTSAQGGVAGQHSLPVGPLRVATKHAGQMLQASTVPAWCFQAYLQVRGHASACNHLIFIIHSLCHSLHMQTPLHHRTRGTSVCADACSAERGCCCITQGLAEHACMDAAGPTGSVRSWKGCLLCRFDTARVVVCAVLRCCCEHCRRRWPVV